VWDRRDLKVSDRACALREPTSGMKLDRALLVLPKHQHGIGFELGRADLLFLVAEAGDGTTITLSGAARQRERHDGDALQCLAAEPVAGERHGQEPLTGRTTGRTIGRTWGSPAPP